MSSVQRGFEPLVPQQQRPDHHVNGKCQRDDPNIGISLIRLENSLIARFNSLLRRKNSLFRCVGNFSVSHCICSRIWPGNLGGFKRRVRTDSLLQRRVSCELKIDVCVKTDGSAVGERPADTACTRRIKAQIREVEALIVVR